MLTLFLYTIDSNNCKIPPLRLTRVFVDLSFPSGRPSTWTALLSTRQSQLSSFHRCSKSQNVESLPRSKSLEPTSHQEEQEHKSTETKLSLPAGEWDVSLHRPDHRHLHHGNCCKHWSCWHPTGRHLYLCICVFVYGRQLPQDRSHWYLTCRIPQTFLHGQNLFTYICLLYPHQLSFIIK